MLITAFSLEVRPEIQWKPCKQVGFWSLFEHPLVFKQTNFRSWILKGSFIYYVCKNFQNTNPLSFFRRYNLFYKTLNLGNIPLSLDWKVISESYFKVKTNLNCYFHTSLRCLKRFYEDLKGLHKTFWGTITKFENKNLVNFLSSSGIGTGGLKVTNFR